MQADSTLWKSEISTTRKVTITGVNRGAEYDCRCAYQGSDQKPVFSETLRILARLGIVASFHLLAAALRSGYLAVSAFFGGYKLSFIHGAAIYSDGAAPY
ncbi:hypothetical protein [Alistipes sp. ZOR0009]|uniref:hypothetical protein n=1 Tax=Alistipes sp. ZOR0009 TaxID=1339253 RepID=UPI00064852D1|nr:hypothetical protein [Alistipes sp. ZOR0009]